MYKLTQDTHCLRQVRNAVFFAVHHQERDQLSFPYALCKPRFTEIKCIQIYANTIKLMYAKKKKEKKANSTRSIQGALPLEVQQSPALSTEKLQRACASKGGVRHSKTSVLAESVI